MLKLHPEILVKNGKKEFVVLPYEEFIALQERLSEVEDLIELRKAKKVERKKKAIPLDNLKRDLGLQNLMPDFFKQMEILAEYLAKARN